MKLLQKHKLNKRIAALSPRLYSIARSWRCSPDLCDDLVQDTLATAFTKVEQLRNEAVLDIWVIRILTNQHRLYLRQHQYMNPLEDDDLIDEVEPFNNIDTDQTVNMVRAAIGLLNSEQCKVLTLVDMENFSYREVAKILDIKTGTVMSRLSRARTRLRQIITELSKPENQLKQKSSSAVKLWRVK